MQHYYPQASAPSSAGASFLWEVMHSSVLAVTAAAGARGNVESVNSGTDAVMSLKDEYRRKAYRYLQMASECADPEIAKGLRMLAADFFDLAGDTASKPTQQQQQIQPHEPGSDNL